MTFSIFTSLCRISQDSPVITETNGLCRATENNLPTQELILSRRSVGKQLLYSIIEYIWLKDLIFGTTKGTQRYLHRDH